MERSRQSCFWCCLTLIAACKSVGFGAARFAAFLATVPSRRAVATVMGSGAGQSCGLKAAAAALEHHPTKGEVVKLVPLTFDRCGRWFESQCRHTLSVLGGFG